MELQTKFIEGTNEQYSIREDGVVFSNYRNKKTKNKEYILYKIIQMRTYNNCLKLAPYKISNSTKILVFKHFGYCICKQCNKKLDYMPFKHVCKECIESHNKAITKKYYNNNKEKYKNYAIEYIKNNPEKYKNKTLKNSQKAIKTITKYYVSKILSLSTKDISDELYNEYRNLLLYKRQIAEKHKISMQSIK
jgi:hypothetical protein